LRRLISGRWQLAHMRQLELLALAASNHADDRPRHT
jgi:hypothetical protein